MQVQYVVRVFTSDMKGAGTDASIDMGLIGPRGETGWHRLVANYDTFERAQVGHLPPCFLDNYPAMFNVLDEYPQHAVFVLMSPLEPLFVKALVSAAQPVQHHSPNALLWGFACCTMCLQEDVFPLTMLDVGVPAFMLLRTDAHSAKPTWHFDFAVVEAPDGRHPPVFFVGQCWLGPAPQVC